MSVGRNFTYDILFFFICTPRHWLKKLSCPFNRPKVNQISGGFRPSDEGGGAGNPDPEIRGGCEKNFFSALRASVWSQNRFMTAVSYDCVVHLTVLLLLFSLAELTTLVFVLIKSRKLF